MAIDWSDIYSRKVRDAFRIALEDKWLTHAEIVDVLKALLSDGELDGTEINDLMKIANTASTMPARSKSMLRYLGLQAFNNKARGPIGIYTDRQKVAARMILGFLKGHGSPKFPNLDRDQVGIDLLYRVANPNVINQGMANICGPVGFLYSVALDAPANYAKFGMDLFENGKAMLGKIKVEPGKDARDYSPPPPLTHGEWLTAGSLRDSANAFYDYDTVFRDGDTKLTEVVSWMRRAGYSDIKVSDASIGSRPVSEIGIINNLYNQNYRVILLIHSNLLDAKTQADKSSASNHYVVLRSPIHVAGNQVKVAVYTWGTAQWNIPGPGTAMTPAGFAQHLYAYVAGKPF